MDSRYPEVAADKVLVELRISGPEDLQLLDQIVYARGGIVREDNLVGAEARLTHVRGSSIITVSSKLTSLERKRFGVSHELGHLEMHPGLFTCSDTDIVEQEVPQSKKRESQANHFASAFLLPARFVKDVFTENIPPTFDLLIEISSTYRVSLTATALRMTKYSQEPVAVVYSERGRIRWFRGTDDFDSLGIFVDVRGPVNSRSVAGRLFSGKVIRDGWREVPAEFWLREGGYREDATIKESSLHMPKYESVLTLLWVDEIIEHDELLF